MNRTAKSSWVVPTGSFDTNTVEFSRSLLIEVEKIGSLQHDQSFNRSDFEDSPSERSGLDDRLDW